MNQHELLGAMKLCAQNEHQSVLEHGESVASYQNDLIRYLDDGDEAEKEYEWRLPSWLMTYRRDILDTVFNGHCYALYHDCGKPFCRVVDEDGKVHFPDHAEVSKRTFQEVFAEDPRIAYFPETANLIGWDMIFHTADAVTLQSYMENEWTARDAVTLLMAALAEIHSNAAMFGGLNSTSFKIKWKQLDRRGKQALKHYFGERHSE
jgi:hypothetical protein